MLIIQWDPIQPAGKKLVLSHQISRCISIICLDMCKYIRECMSRQTQKRNACDGAFQLQLQILANADYWRGWPRLCDHLLAWRFWPSLGHQNCSFQGISIVYAQICQTAQPKKHMFPCKAHESSTKHYVCIDRERYIDMVICRWWLNQSFFAHVWLLSSRIPQNHD